MKLCDIQLIDSNLIEAHDESTRNNILEIIRLLKTSRNIKRWVVELARIKAIIKAGEINRFFWFNITAIFIVNPQCLTKFSHERKEYTFPESLLPKNLQDKYDNYIGNIPEFHIQAFLENDLEDESKFDLMDDFFEGYKINNVLTRFLQDHEDEGDKVIIDDIADRILRCNEKVSVNAEPDLKFLLRIWDKFIQSNDIYSLELMYNSYYIIILHLLEYVADSKQKIKEISECSLVLGEKYLINLLQKNGIENKQGEYNLEGKEELKGYVREWIDAAKTVFSKELNDSSMLSLISVCYRYLQWSKSADNDEQEAVSNLIKQAKNYFQNDAVQDMFKCNFLRAVSSSFGFGEDHLEKLFNRDNELVSIMKKYADKHKLSLENYDRMFPQTLPEH